MQVNRLDSANVEIRVAAIWAAVQRALEEKDAIDLSWIQHRLSDASWSLCPSALRFLVGLVKHLKPEHILEFGSGVSTQVLARSCKELHLASRITSVDHDPEFAATTARELKQQKLSRRLRMHIAPLVARECAGKILPQYCLRPKDFASAQPPDLVIIDGPPAALGGRQGIMYQVMNLARIGTLVLLDDAQRAGEKAALSGWQADFGKAIEVDHLQGFPKGMAAIIVREPVPSSGLFEHRLRLISEEIRARIPSGDTFILVNDDNWNAGDTVSGRRVLPFLERHGQYWGPPVDGVSAIRELERLRQCGASSIVFTWPSFWWLDYYCELHNHLRSNYQCLVEDERIMIFHL